jgi:hypothetical protein
MNYISYQLTDFEAKFDNLFFKYILTKRSNKQLVALTQFSRNIFKVQSKILLSDMIDIDTYEDWDIKWRNQ